MSSPDPHICIVRRSRAGAAMRVVTAVAIVLLAGCAGGEGFRPLHGTTASNPGVQARMAAIDVAPIPSRVGQRIRNELIFQNTGGGDPVKPQYRLVLTLRESLGSTLVKNSGEALSQIYTLDAQFKLYRLTDNKVIVEGSSHGRAGFERFQQIYANVRAREDAENRAARSVADDIKTRLAAMLSSSQI